LTLETKTRTPFLVGVLVTFRRPRDLAEVLDRLEGQDRRLDRLIVIDNGPSSETEDIVKDRPHAARSVEYLPMAENVGFAGGVARGMDRALEIAQDHDWVVVFDDDDPPTSRSVLGELQRFAIEMKQRDADTAAVGLTGARFDWRRGRIQRVPDGELTGPVPLDYVAGGHLPLFSVRAIRDVGPFSSALFFGLSEIEYGLRLRRAGYTIYGHGELWLEGRARAGRLNTVIRPGLRLPELAWRRYYGLRNTIYVLRTYGHPGSALRVTLVRGLAKPLANLPVSPRSAIRHLRLNWKACRDAWAGRMGRVVEPDPRSKRTLEIEASR
jgi:glycosyltransferase involved in cell wall biosynthesis